MSKIFNFYHVFELIVMRHVHTCGYGVTSKSHCGDHLSAIASCHQLLQKGCDNNIYSWFIRIVN